MYTSIERRDNIKKIKLSPKTMILHIDTSRYTLAYLFTFGGGRIMAIPPLKMCFSLHYRRGVYKHHRGMQRDFVDREIIQEAWIKKNKSVVYNDSQSFIHVSKNPSVHSHSMHIIVHYHWVRDIFDEKQLYLYNVHTDDNGSNKLPITYQISIMIHVSLKLVWAWNLLLYIS